MRVQGVSYRTVWMDRGVVNMIDQRALPFHFAIVSLPTYRDTAEAIRDMTVRGAGVIGVAAGYAMAQAVLEAPPASFDDAMATAESVLRATRPTAQNLFYAIERMRASLSGCRDAAQRRAQAVACAQAIADEDAAAGEAIGMCGQAILGASATVITHCNAGWLAFADWGTALAPIYQAHREGKRIHVYATETRPRSQGAKLTAWELAQEGVPCTIIPDTAAGSVIRRGLITCVIVGADRIAANGDVANKIGTYPLAVLAQTHRVPFYVAAPTTTIDLACATGDAIPIEERSEEEVLWVTGLTADGRLERVRIAAADARARNWAFDVTPASLITALITNRGIIAAEPRAIRDIMRAHPSGVTALIP